MNICCKGEKTRTGRWCELVFLASRKREAIEPSRVPLKTGFDCPERQLKVSGINNADYCTVQNDCDQRQLV